MKAVKFALMLGVLAAMATPSFGFVFTNDYPATRDMFFGRGALGTTTNYGTLNQGRVGKLAMDGYIVDFDRTGMLNWIQTSSGVTITDVNQLGNGALTMTLNVMPLASGWDTNIPPVPTVMGYYFWPGVRLSKGANWSEMTGTYSQASPGVPWHDKDGNSLVSIYGGFTGTTTSVTNNMVINGVSETWGAKETIGGGEDYYLYDTMRPWKLDSTVAFAALKNPDAVGFQLVPDMLNKPWAAAGQFAEENGCIYGKEYGLPENRPYISIILDTDKLIANTQTKTYLAGDCNKDGYVKFADYLILEQNFGKTAKTWADGDFTGDGNVKFADYLLLEQNFGKKASWAVPEPATMSLLVLGGMAMLRRRTR